MKTAALLPVGRDHRTGGYRRHAWSAADLTCREWFAERGRTARASTVTCDRNGNQWAWWGDPDADGPGVVTGSHLDSVPDGGAYDGPLGVVGRLRRGRPAARDRASRRTGRWASSASPTRRAPGSASPCAGSRLLTGALDAGPGPGAHRRRRHHLAEAMTAAGHDPATSAATTRRCAGSARFVELHVEQGRALVDVGAPVGVGERHLAARPLAARPQRRGQPRGHHPARGPRRPDAPPCRPRCSPPASRPTEHGAVATFGKVARAPNGANAIPSSVRAWLDARGADEDDGARRASPRSRSGRRRPTAGAEESVDARVRFDAALRDRLARRCSAACRCCRPGPATTPASSPTPASRRRCCSCATPPASATRPPSTPSTTTASPASRRWPPCWPTSRDRPARMTTLTGTRARLAAAGPASVARRHRRGRGRPHRRGRAEGAPGPGDASTSAGWSCPGWRTRTRTRSTARCAAAPSAARRQPFWTWREQMYGVAGRLDPDTLPRAGPGDVRRDGAGRDHRGRRVPLPAPRTRRHALRRPERHGPRAGRRPPREAGLRITLLDACYLAGGIGAAARRACSCGSATATRTRWAARADALPRRRRRPDVVSARPCTRCAPCRRPAGRRRRVGRAARGAAARAPVRAARGERGLRGARTASPRPRLLHDARRRSARAPPPCTRPT